MAVLESPWSTNKAPGGMTALPSGRASNFECFAWVTRPERDTDLNDSRWVRSMKATAENYTRHGVQHPHAQATMGTEITPTNST